MDLTYFLNLFRSTPTTIDSLTESEQAALRALLQTQQSFTDEQRALLSHWYLLVPDDRLSELQELGDSVPLFKFEPIQNGTEWLINADLLTDEVHYGWAFPVLRSLVLVERETLILPDINLG